MCPMIKRRCTCYAISYRNDIFVFGGYTGNRKRDRLIEKYDKLTDTWEAM